VSYTLRRRPGELASSVSIDEPFSEHPSEPRLIPGSRTTCPAECTPRPRNLPEYKAACAGAAGEPVREINACQAMPGIRIWHSSHFLTVSSNLRDGNRVELLLYGTGYVASRYCALDTPVYCLA
jgi:hypothetical protein